MRPAQLSRQCRDNLLVVNDLNEVHLCSSPGLLNPRPSRSRRMPAGSLSPRTGCPSFPACLRASGCGTDSGHDLLVRAPRASPPASDADRQPVPASPSQRSRSLRQGPSRGARPRLACLDLTSRNSHYPLVTRDEAQALADVRGAMRLPTALSTGHTPGSACASAGRSARTFALP